MSTPTTPVSLHSKGSEVLNGVEIRLGDQNTYSCLSESLVYRNGFQCLCRSGRWSRSLGCTRKGPGFDGPLHQEFHVSLLDVVVSAEPQTILRIKVRGEIWTT